MNEPEKEKYITKTELKTRGWTEEMIAGILPPPLVKPNPHYTRGKMYLWKEKDVVNGEKRQEFIDHCEKRKVYQKRAEAAVRTKNEKMRTILAKAIEEIHVKQVSFEKVTLDALRAKQYWYMATGQDDMSVQGADSRTVERWTVNYIRHRLTEYDSFLFSAKGKTGISFAYPLYRKAVLEKIAEVYPSLEEECQRQISRNETENEHNDVQW